MTHKMVQNGLLQLQNILGEMQFENTLQNFASTNYKPRESMQIFNMLRIKKVTIQFKYILKISTYKMSKFSLLCTEN